MEPTQDRLVEDIDIHENFNPSEVSLVFNKYSGEDKKMMIKSLLEDFKRLFLQTEPPLVKSDLFKKAHFVSCLGYGYCLEIDNDIKDFIIDHLKNSRKPYVLSTPNNIFLKSLTTIWEIYIEALTTLNDVMEYMKSIHSVHNKLQHFDKFAIILFCHIIFEDNRVQKCFYARIAELKQVTTRNIILLNSDRLLIENVSKMCYALKTDDCYVWSVKPLLLKLTTEYFQLLSENYILHYCGPCDYFENAILKITEEMNRMRLKLDTESINEIRGIITTELVLKHINTIIGVESCSIDHMLKNDQYDTLKHLYNTLGFVNGGLKVMFDSTRPYFSKLGASIVETNIKISDAFTCIEGLLILKDKFDYLMENVFNNNKLFYDTISDEFSMFLKLNSLIPKFLCQFIDQKLRKGKYLFIKNHTTADLRNVSFLVQHLEDKISFEEFYLSSLATRLLNEESISMEMENSAIEMYKSVLARPSHYHSLFVSRIERMFKEKFLLTKSIMESYNNHVLVDRVILGIMRPFDLNVDILSAVYCRVVSPHSMCKVPSFAMNAFNDFHGFYSKYKTKKTLKLLPQFGTAELEVTRNSQREDTEQSCDGEHSTTEIERVERKTKVVVSTYEMFVLDLFNSNDSLTGQMILKETMIPEDSLLVSLDKLVDHHKLLIKNPVCKEIKLSDTFYVKEDIL